MRSPLAVAAAACLLGWGLCGAGLGGLWADPPAVSGAPAGKAARSGAQALAAAALDIDTAVQLAVGSSDELRFAYLERNLAAERTRLSVRSFLPAVTLGYAQNQTVAYGGPDSRLRRLSVGLQQTLFARGIRVQQYRLRTVELGLQSRALAQARAGLVLEVINLYLAALKLRLQRGILEDSHRNALSQLAVAAEELRLGEITELAYLELTVAAKDLELELARMRQAEERAAFELRRALGLEEDPEVSGTINENYQGLLEDREPAWYVAACLSRNLELHRKQAELYGLRGQLAQSKASWLPGIVARLDLSMAGEQFPLTEPGFSLGLDFELAPPLLPAAGGVTAGTSGTRERSVGMTGSFEVGGNVEELLARRLSTLKLDQARGQLDALKRELEFAVREQLQARQHQLEALKLLRQKQGIAERGQGIRSLMVELGELTRLEFVEGETALARLRIEILTGVVELFNREVALLEQCGLPGLETSHRAIVRSGGLEP